MEYIKLSTTKYLSESLKEEKAHTRSANRKEATRLMFMTITCLAIFAGTFYLVAKNPDVISAIMNSF